MTRNTDYEMERGVAQVLNSYGSHNVFDFGQLGLMMQTNPWRQVETLDDVDRERVADIIQSRVNRYRNRTTGDEWEDLNADSIEIYRPLRVEGTLYPRVFYCENADCRKVETAAKKDHLHLLPDDGECEECGDSLTQLPFVNVCTCGKLKGPGPSRPCDTDGFDDYRLRKTSGGPATWRYHCRKCGEEMGGLSDSCGTCNEMKGPLPTASSRIFYPEKAVEVDIPPIGVEPEDLPGGETWARVLMAVYLDRDHLDEETLEDLATSEGDAQKFEKWKKKLGSEEVREMFDDFGESIRGRETLVQETEEIQPPDTDEDVEEGIAPLAYSNIAHQLFTFLRSTDGYEGNQNLLEDTRHPKPNSLSSYLDNPRFKERHPQSGRYRAQLTTSHIRQAWVVDQFPLLNILYGYTRADSQSINVDLNSFPHPRERASIPVFADRTPSEAIIFELDRAAIVDWLAQNGVIHEDNLPDRTSETALRKWFLNNIATTELDNPFTETKHEITKWVYRLLHTMSHCLLARAGEQCGLATDSLSERILPVIPAIVIYAASTENFALGSMFTLFKTRLHPWVSDARDLADRCLLDPVCSEDPEGAACDACVHIGETTCEALNHDLDRRLLSGNDSIVGFWDDRISNGIDPDDFPSELSTHDSSL